jgi:uncharacterized protein (TIGR00266 family)
MQVSVRHSPSFAVARVDLTAGEQMRAESGAMMTMSGDMQLDAKMEGGFMKSLKRSVLGGESLFISTYTAGSAGGFVDVAAQLPGDIVVFDLQADRAMFLTRGSWLASPATVALDTQWGGFKNLFGGEGGFLVRCTGNGPLVTTCYGALEVWNLGAGERLVVDSGHLVAYQEGVQLQTRMVSRGAMKTIKSGEGLVMEFTGPGQVWTQTRSPGMLIDWLTTVLPFSRS